MGSLSLDAYMTLFACYLLDEPLRPFKTGGECWHLLGTHCMPQAILGALCVLTEQKLMGLGGRCCHCPTSLKQGLPRGWAYPTHLARSTGARPHSPPPHAQGSICLGKEDGGRCEKALQFAYLAERSSVVPAKQMCDPSSEKQNNKIYVAIT